jgi:hypothetical protein
MFRQRFPCFFMEMATGSHTKIKAFRLETNLILSLKRAARRLEVSENMYVMQVLTRALMTDPLTPAFGRIELGVETFASILSTANPDSLEIDGFALGKKNYSLFREILESIGCQMTFIQFLVKMLAGAAEWFVVEGNVNDSSEQLTLRHKYGEKWSLFLKSYISGAYAVLSAGKLQIDVKGTILKIRFPTTSKSN